RHARINACALLVAAGAALGRVAAGLGGVAAVLGRIAPGLGCVAAALGRVAPGLGLVTAALGRVASGLGRVAAALGRVRATCSVRQLLCLGRIHPRDQVLDRGISLQSSGSRVQVLGLFVHFNSFGTGFGCGLVRGFGVAVGSGLLEVLCRIQHLVRLIA